MGVGQICLFHIICAKILFMLKKKIEENHQSYNWEFLPHQNDLKVTTIWGWESTLIDSQKFQW